MSRWILMTILFAVHVLTSDAASAQVVEPGTQSPRAARLFMGAALGSAAGTVFWIYGGSLESTPAYQSLLKGVAITSLGSALGAWLAEEEGVRPGFGRLFAAGAIGAVAGVGVAIMAGRLSGDGRAMVVGFSVSQAAVTALVGSQPPRLRSARAADR